MDAEASYSDVDFVVIVTPMNILVLEEKIMKKVLLVTNIPAPYRVDLFYYLQTHVKQYEFYVMYCAKEADNRCWNVDNTKLLNTTFTKTKVISIKKKYDTKHIYIPKGIGKDLSDINPDVVVGWEYNPIAVVIGVLTQNNLYEKTVSNMLECKSRGVYLMGLTTYGNYEIEDQVNFTVYVPKVDEHFVGSLAVVPLQLMGYYVSVAKGLDVDRPRNLAKSVTVE